MLSISVICGPPSPEEVRPRSDGLRYEGGWGILMENSKMKIYSHVYYVYYIYYSDSYSQPSLA